MGRDGKSREISRCGGADNGDPGIGERYAIVRRAAEQDGGLEHRVDGQGTLRIVGSHLEGNAAGTENAVAAVHGLRLIDGGACAG